MRSCAASTRPSRRSVPTWRSPARSRSSPGSRSAPPSRPRSSRWSAERHSSRRASRSTPSWYAAWWSTRAVRSSTQAHPGARLASYRGVSQVPFQATFERSVALEPANKGVHFLTPAHPLVRAVLQRVRARLWVPGARDRVAVRVATGAAEPGYLFTFTARIQGEDGTLLEEPLLRVWVAIDGTVSQDHTADERRFRAPRAGGDAAAWAQAHLEAGFDRAVRVAGGEARRRLDVRGEALGVELQAQVQRLEVDLEHWRDAERAEARRRFERGGADEPAQLGLFADDPAAGPLATLDEALTAIDQIFAERAGQLARAHRVGEVAGPDPF